jgi:methionine-rich copper-binding protein CopC
MVTRALFAIATVFALLASVSSATAHADLESSVPTADSIVPSAPLTLDLTFIEEVSSGGVTVRVVGPAGDEVQAGTAEVDLNDPERRHVTLSLRGNLPPGRYNRGVGDHLEPRRPRRERLLRVHGRAGGLVPRGVARVHAGCRRPRRDA